MSKTTTARAGDIYETARENPYVQRLIEDEELRDSLKDAFESAKSAYGRATGNGKGTVKAVTSDKKVQKDLRKAAESLQEASESLRSKPKRKYTKLKVKQFEQIAVRLTPPSGKSFSPNARASQATGRAFAGLTLKSVVAKPEQAYFVWSSWVSLNVRGRGGWVSPAAKLDSRHLIATLIASHKLAGAAQQRAA